MELWVKNHKEQEVLLEDIITLKPPVGVCRHRSLLYKVLGDELGLKVELQRGNIRQVLIDFGMPEWMFNMALNK